MTANPFLTGVFCHRIPTLEQDLFESKGLGSVAQIICHVRLQRDTRNFVVHDRGWKHCKFPNPNTEGRGSVFVIEETELCTHFRPGNRSCTEMFLT